MGEPAYREWSGPDRRRRSVQPLLGSVTERLDELEEELDGLLWLFPIDRSVRPVRAKPG